MPVHRAVLVLACACSTLISVAEAAKSECPRAMAVPGLAAPTGPAVELFGTISKVQGNQLIIETRDGKQLTIDATPALTAQESTPLVDGRAVDILGTEELGGVVRADVIRHAKDAPTSWGADCLPAQ